ncbi:FAD binding domain-containing protein [Boeremia exigua]|uniref:FAD binding domain-containing protein n=1 Tax=Boeremia exigua TaxID=749465 RepID=UPI001E8CA9DA|nr:FAD binding domain-containing protein [Boeremia exigua]KAH6629404.1 FAD binding domain-containing protein [Boeremia exigua]
MKVLLTFLSACSGISALAIRAPTIAQDLATLVSTASSVSIELNARWSDFNAPLPSVVVNVTSEDDVAATVKYCTKGNIPFLAQNGGVAWANIFDLGQTGVLINLAGLNTVTVSDDKKSATIGGGASIGETIAAADAADALVLTGNCNCVGSVSAYLGGGYGNLMGDVGFGVDNIISLRVVTADGSIRTISKTSDADLFWAFRGAGPNFGVVISATVKASPATATDRTAWINNLFFPASKLPEIAQTIEDLPLAPEQRVYLVLTSGGPPLNEPSVLVTGFMRKANEATGRAAFKPLYDLQPASESGAVTPYANWNDANINFCVRGGRKPSFSTTITSMKPDVWPQIWDAYTAFQAKGPNTAVLIERYNLTAAKAQLDGATALNPALRQPAFAQAIVIPWYDDAGLDDEALAFGRGVRDLWSDAADATQNPTYANFAHGDESLEAIYGTSLPRLRKVKKTWDPKGVFGQWFPIK